MVSLHLPAHTGIDPGRTSVWYAKQSFTGFMTGVPCCRSAKGREDGCGQGRRSLNLMLTPRMRRIRKAFTIHTGVGEVWVQVDN